jgi:hypothetical protein
MTADCSWNPNNSFTVFHFFVCCDREIATDYSFTCLYAIHVSVVCCQSGTDKNWNFSAVRSPIGLKLSGDLGLVSQISVHVLVSRFVYFSYCKQTKEKNTPKSRKWRFYKTCVFSAVPTPIDLKLGGDIQTSTMNSVVCLFCLYYCLFTFCKHKQRKHTL